jgi:hypothetical protein
MFGSTRRPGMRGRNSLNLGGYLAAGDDQVIPAVATSDRFAKVAVYASVAADIVIAIGGALAIVKALHRK